jgi:hypothetical protein
MATATKMENVRGFPDYLEKAETGSVGRALAYCGFGTQFAPELEEESRFADAPYASSGNRPRPNGSRPAPMAGRPPVEGGILRVREPERPSFDPGGSDEDDEEFLLEDGSEAGEGTSSETPKANPLAGNRCSIEGCSHVLTAGQMTMSLNKYGQPLCLLHQKDAAMTADSAGANVRRTAANDSRN